MQLKPSRARAGLKKFNSGQSGREETKPMFRRTFLSRLAVLLSTSLLKVSPGEAISKSGSDASDFGEVVGAVDELLQALQPESRKQIQFTFEDLERKDWSNVPNAVYPRHGLAFGNMSDAEKIAAHRLLAAIASPEGYLKATAIMGLENVLHEIKPPEERTKFSPDFYFLSVFGNPRADDRWAIRVNGHHLALYLTVVSGKASGTPAFFGTEPATVQHGHLAGLRVLGAETTKGLVLRKALTAEQARLAVLAEELPPDIFTGPGREQALRQPAGIRASQLHGSQHQLLESLIDEYLGNLQPDVARSYRRRIQADGIDTVRFAWMGSSSPGKPVYYRVHGPGLLIEYDNSLAVGTRVKFNDPNHIHTILRVPGNDFGGDWLRNHHLERHSG